MTIEAKSDLTVRKIPFEFPDDIDPQWIPNEPELSAMFNGGSVVMPYLEPFLIRTMREVLKQLDDSGLSADAVSFMAQEGQHFKTHRRFNDLLKAKRYPELAQVEEAMVKSYAKLAKKNLRTRLAYSAGFEAMTLGVTKWIIERRVKLFAGSDTRIASFILWHMVEETEHKRVAYDLYTAVYPASLSSYWARMIGVFHGSLDVIRFSMRSYKIILKKEKLWTQLSSRLRLASQLTQFMAYVGPFLLRSALPGHNPRNEKDPQWVLDWLEGYAKFTTDHPPLVNTSDPDMPVPFGINQIKAAI